MIGNDSTRKSNTVENKNQVDGFFSCKADILSRKCCEEEEGNVEAPEGEEHGDAEEEVCLVFKTRQVQDLPVATRWHTLFGEDIDEEEEQAVDKGNRAHRPWEADLWNQILDHGWEN